MYRPWLGPIWIRIRDYDHKLSARMGKPSTKQIELSTIKVEYIALSKVIRDVLHFVSLMKEMKIFLNFN